MELLKNIFSHLNIGFVWLAGWYMTQRVYPPLNNLQSIFGVKHNKKLKSIVDSLSRINLSHDPKVEKMKVEVCEAFLTLCDSYSDNEASVADAVKRLKEELSFLSSRLFFKAYSYF